MTNELSATLKRENNKRVFFYIFLFLYLAGLIFLCDSLNVSTDELFTLDTTSHGFSKVIKQSYDFEGQPPVYFLLVAAWRVLNSSLFFARLFSVLSVMLAALSFYKFICVISKNGCSRWLVILFLLNPYTVWCGLEARLYAFLLFLSATSLYLFFRFFIENRLKYLILFSFSCIIGLYTMYIYMYLLGALGLSLLIFKGWKIFFKFCIYTLPVGLLFLYNFFFMTNPMELTYINSIVTTIPERIITVLHSPQNLVLALQMVGFARVFRWAVMLLFIFLTIFSYLKWFKREQKANDIHLKSFNAVMLSAAVLVILFCALFAVTGLDYHDRYLTIGFCFFITVLVLLQMYSFIKRNLIFAGIALLYITLLISEYKYQVKEYDTKALITHLNKIEKDNEPLCFYQKVLALPVMHYYKGKNPIVPLPDGLKFDSSYMSKIRDTNEVKKAFYSDFADSKSFLLITDRIDTKFDDDVDMKMLNEYLPKHFQTTFDTVFYGHGKLFPLRIRRIEKIGR